MRPYRTVMEKYSRQARSYDQRWNRSFGHATLQAAVEAVPWKSLKRVLDVGCGTGLLEETVRSHLHSPIRVIGVDISLAMLQHAQQKLLTADRISWTNAQAEHLPFSNGSFDAVVCANSFHYYRQPLPVLKEFRRVLRPGGCLVLADWCDDFLICKLGHWALRLADRARLHRYALKRCYSMKQFSELLTMAGFRIVSGRRLEIDWGWGVMVYNALA